LVLTPLAKYGLMMQPLNISWELWMFSHPMVESWLNITWRKNALMILGRACITASLVYIALIFPGFDKVMVSVHILLLLLYIQLIRLFV
jgi:vesicular inhibitory amino acid transporter